MKNSLFYIFLIFLFFPNSLFSENLSIQSKNILIDKNSKLTVFENEVVAKDEKGNEFRTNRAEYNKKFNLLKSKDETTILTSEGFKVSGKNILFAERIVCGSSETITFLLNSSTALFKLRMLLLPVFIIIIFSKFCFLCPYSNWRSQKDLNPQPSRP